MQNEIPEFDDENDEEEINVEEWLFALMAMTGNQADMDELVRKISSKTGQSLDEVETIITATILELA